MRIDYNSWQIRVLIFTGTIFLVGIFSGTRSFFPLIWNDSTSYISSAIQTLNSGNFHLDGGVNVGYVWVLSLLLNSEQDFTLLVFIQQFFWAFSAALCGYTFFRISRQTSYWYLLPFIVLASYPGIQIYNNLVLTESLFTSSIACALCFSLLAWRESSLIRCIIFLIAGLGFAVFAALTKAQGLGPYFIIAIFYLYMLLRLPWKAAVLCFTGFIMVLSVAVSGHNLREGSSDHTSKLFGAKTLLCLHLDQVMNARSTEALAKQAFGNSSETIMTRLRNNIVVTKGEYGTLGYDADVCQFDKGLDALGIDAHRDGADGLAKWYASVFFAAVGENPWAYMKKVTHQVVYGLKMSVPPHAIANTVNEVAERKAISLDMLRDAGLGDRGLVEDDEPLSAPIVGHVRFSVLLFRVLSLVVAVGLILAIAGVFMKKWRASREAVPAMVAALVWFSLVGGTAMTHTLDIWRYLVPVVPAATLTLMLVFVVCINWLKREGWWPFFEKEIDDNKVANHHPL